MRLRTKPRPDSAETASASGAPAALATATRPGLPPSLSALRGGRVGYDSRAMQDAAAAAKSARDSIADTAERTASPEARDAGSEGGAAEEQAEKDGAEGAEAAEAGTEEGAEEPELVEGDEAEQAAGGGEAPSAAAARPSAFPLVRAPVLPMVLLPDLNAIRTPLVPPPPLQAMRRRDKILKASGLTPESHHATVQQGVNRVADVARSAQREVVAQVGSIAARTRFKIEQLADIVPRVVAGGVARIRAENKRVRGEVKKTAVAQMIRVANHEDVAQGDMKTSRAATNLQMQEMLLRDAPDDLTKAKKALDDALDRAAAEAGQRIRGIVNGQEPQSVADGVTLNARERAAADKAAKERQARLAKHEHQTFAAAAVPLDAKLMQDRPTQRLAQYGNLQCSAALTDLVAEQQELYDKANQATVDNLNSPENKARFFDQSMQLSLPIGKAFQEDEEGFYEHLRGNVEDEGLHLNDAQKTVLRQMDQRLSTVLEETLNEDVKDSIPYQAIKGLRDAGKQIAQGLRDQAKTVEASLKSNLAQLAEAYPDLVDRLMPLVESGEFLEATAMLGRLAEAEASIDTLRDGQIRSVAEQAASALAQARAGFDKQIAGLHKSTRKSVRTIARFEHRAKWDFMRAATAYTGLIDEGMAASIPMLQAHATELAQRLLGPKTHKNQTFDNFKTAAIRYLNGVMAGEWESYLQRVNKLEETLGGVQEGAEGTGDVTGEERNGNKPFRQIRDGVRSDTLDRANKIVNALPPRPPTGLLVLGYISPIPGPIATGIVHYMTDPEETGVVSALSIPWPGPCAIHERHQQKDRASLAALGNAFSGSLSQIVTNAALAPVDLVFGGDSESNTIYGLIRDRMDEPERSKALDLFSTEVATRSEAKQALLNASGGLFGISEEAAMALAQSLTADEVSAEVMSPAQRAELAENLRDTLSPPNQEIAAAYVNNQPDLALALRMRNHFNSTRNRAFNEQMDSGQEMEALIQRELFMSGNLGYVPPARLKRMREAALIRFAGLVEQGQGETPRSDAQVSVTVDLSGPAPTPRAPLTAGQIPQPPAPPPGETANRPRSDAPSDVGPSPAAPPPQRQPEQPSAARPAEAARQRELARQQRLREEALRPPSAEEAEARARDLRSAQQMVVEHLNRPRVSQLRQDNRYLQDSVERRPQIGFGVQARQRRYDPETGRYEVDPAQAVQNYNRALVMHGPSEALTRAARAVAEISRTERGFGGLSTTETNRLHERFTDREFAAMRARWREASPRERRGMQGQWEEAQRKHAEFLRFTAEGLGMTQGLDDRAAVEAFVSDRLGAQFAREGEDFRDVGRQIVEQGRVDIDLGTRLAGGGYDDGTNEALLQSVIAGRRQSEFAERSRLNPRRSMGEYARQVVNREVDGDEWQKADISLMGTPENDLDRAAIAQRRFEHQRQEGTGPFARFTMTNQHETRWLESSRDDVDARVLAAAEAGIERARELGVDVSGVEMPRNPRLPDGSWHPAVRRFAMDGDGRLRGKGPLMSSLANDVEQTAGFYRQEIDRQEAFLTGAITVLAIVVSVALMFIPGVNLVAAGILTALIAGAATITVKAGMRGGRYGWEEMATDMATTAIEAATAGIGGKLGAGARLAQRGQKARGVARVGAALQTRFGSKLAPIASEAITGAMGGAANAALDDKLWDDGIGTGMARVAGRGLQGAASSAANAGISGALTRGMQSRLSPNVPRGKEMGRLNRAGRALGPNGREMVEEIVSNVGGALTSETVNFLADVMVYLAKGHTWEEIKKSMGGAKGIAARFGKAALKEGATAAARTGVKQMHRAQAQRMAAQLHKEMRDPSPAEAALMNRIAKSGGLVDEATSTADYARNFSRTRARMADMPEALRKQMIGMDPDSAAALIEMMDSGQLGTRKARKAFVNELSLKMPGLNADSFDAILLQANRDHKPARQARKRELRATRDRLLAEVRGPERAALQQLDASDLVGLPAATMRRLASAVGEADADPVALKRLAHDLIGDDPGLAARVAQTLQGAVKATAEARAEVRRARARTRDDLMLAAPEGLRETIGQMKPRDLETLTRLMKDGDEAALQAAFTLVMRADPGLEPAATRALVVRMRDSAEMESARFAHLDNVPPQHRAVMAQLPDDALMELRVAQYRREPLAPARVEAILAGVKRRRPGADLVTLRKAIDDSLAHPHGRPGFREALSQKRALLDMVPWGMKRTVLRTPVLTLPESAFLSYVRGKGNENAVTLIVNGRPVILMRQGADVRALAEEGIHVLQFQDPDWRSRVSGIDEGRMARWDEMTVDQQIAAYRAKMAIEIDAQNRIIARLDQRAALAALPGTRRMARLQLEVAEKTLAALKSRLERAKAVTPDEMIRMAAAPELRPSWLRQPARMFSKGPDTEAVFARLVPGVDGEVGAEYKRLAADMNKAGRFELANTIRLLHGAVPRAELLRVLKAIRPAKDSDATFPHLSRLPPRQVAKRLADEFLLVSPARRGAAEALVKEVGDMFHGLSGAGGKKALIDGMMQTLLDTSGSRRDLGLAKRAFLLRLANLPKRSKPQLKLKTLEYAAKILGVPPHDGDLPALRGRQVLQAVALEGLTITKSLHLDGDGVQITKLSENAFFLGVRNLMEGDLAGARNADQKAALRHLSANFFSGATDTYLTRFVAFMNAAAKYNADNAGRGDRLDLHAIIHTLDSYPEKRARTDMLAALKTLTDKALGRTLSGTPGGPAVTAAVLTRYLRAALKDPAMRLSLRLLARRADQGGGLGDEEIDALLHRKTVEIDRTRDEFVDRFADELEGSDPLQGTKEDYAKRLSKDALSRYGLELSLMEARSIAQRIEVLEHNALFSAVTGRARTRDELMGEFLRRAKDVVAGVTKENDRGTKIEDAFRAFVRHMASDNVDVIRVMGSTDMSDAARRAMIDILLRGDIRHQTKGGKRILNDLPDEVRREVETAKTAMIERYRKAYAEERLPAMSEADLRQLLDRGIFDVETTGKGSMMEVMLNRLLWEFDQDLMPENLRGVYSLLIAMHVGTQPGKIKATRVRFSSIDQLARDPTSTKNQRSFDHLFKVADMIRGFLDEGPGSLAGPKTREQGVLEQLGLGRGDLIGVDAKNGKGAFSENQFKRYLVEMMKGIVEAEAAKAGQPRPTTVAGAEINVLRDPSKFGGAEGLKAMMYISNNATNMFKTRAKAADILRKILTDAAKTGRLEMKIGDVTYDLTKEMGITPQMLLENRQMIQVLFGRIGQTGTADASLPGQVDLGPLVLTDPVQGLPAIIQEILGAE